MTEPEFSPEERRRRNLESVARYHLHGAAAAPPAATADPSVPAPPARWKHWLARLGPPGLLLLFVLSKAKLLVPLLQVAKFGTLLTMFLTIWVYAQFWGAPFAVGFVLLIFVHELGHALVMQQQGLRAGAPVFIPFVGAVIAMKHLPRNAYIEALVGIGGPVLGSAGALACLLVAWSTGSAFWYALAYTGFLLNLFNLLPISPLDGGRIVGSVSRAIWVVGYAIGVALFLATYNPMLFLILLLGLFGLRSTMRGHRPDYYDVTLRQRWTIGLAYFGLIALLVLGLQVAEVPTPTQDGGTPGISGGF